MRLLLKDLANCSSSSRSIFSSCNKTGKYRGRQTQESSADPQHTAHRKNVDPDKKSLIQVIGLHCLPLSQKSDINLLIRQRNLSR